MDISRKQDEVHKYYKHRYSGVHLDPTINLDEPNFIKPLMKKTNIPLHAHLVG